jgi:CMP-N-acetylneuraminic acid synthetase
VIENRRVLVVVLARGGSKGLPRKNARLLGGKPLVAHAVEAGRAAAFVDRVVCSTDDEAIAEMARAAGAEVPFLRPAELAQDTTEDWPVFAHALAWLDEHEGWRPDIVVNLRPSTPLRRPGLVDDALRVLVASGADSVKSVCLARQHPHKMWLLVDGGPRMEPYEKTPFRLERGPDVPRAELQPVYWQTGHVDATWRRTIVDDKRLIGPRAAAVVVEPELSIDIDGPFELELAELLLKRQTEAAARPR